MDLDSSTGERVSVGQQQTTTTMATKITLLRKVTLSVEIDKDAFLDLMAGYSDEQVEEAWTRLLAGEAGDDIEDHGALVDTVRGTTRVLELEEDGGAQATDVELGDALFCENFADALEAFVSEVEVKSDDESDDE